MKLQSAAYVIIVQNPCSNKMKAIVDGEGDIAIFATQRSAVLATLEIPTCRDWPFDIIDIGQYSMRPLSSWLSSTKITDVPAAAHRSAA